MCLLAKWHILHFFLVCKGKFTLYNTTIYDSYKSEAERKNLCEVGNLQYTDTGKTILFSVKYKTFVFSVSSSQYNSKQIGNLVVLDNVGAIDFYETVDVRSQRLNNLLYAMDALIEKGDLH